MAKESAVTPSILQKLTYERYSSQLGFGMSQTLEAQETEHVKCILYIVVLGEDCLCICSLCLLLDCTFSFSKHADRDAKKCKIKIPNDTLTLVWNTSVLVRSRIFLIELGNSLVQTLCFGNLKG